jgi:hypothetical protein
MMGALEGLGCRVGTGEGFAVGAAVTFVGCAVGVSVRRCSVMWFKVSRWDIKPPLMPSELRRSPFEIPSSAGRPLAGIVGLAVGEAVDGKI